MSQTILRATRIGLVFAFVLGFAASSFAAVTGKLSGAVKDKSTKEPLPAASVRIEGTTQGAVANEKGIFFILNIPPGTYSVTANVIGFQPVTVQGIRIQQDWTTFQDFELESTVLEVKEAIVVTAERPLVEKSLTASRTIVEGSEIKTLPVVNIAEIVLTTAGSFGGNLRGGRPQDQQTTLDGATITGSIGNTGQAFTVNPFMIQELEVKTGTYNAEYVNALSGITSVVTKDGGSKFSGNAEFRTLGQKGLNHLKPPGMDLVDKYRSKESNKQDLLDLIHTAINVTNGFNNDPKRATDGFKLQFPFDKLDTASSDPAQWTASYNRDNLYWDYDRVNPEAEAPGFSYLTQGRAVALNNSGLVDRSYNPNKYNEYQKHNRTEKRPVQLDWGMGGPLGKKINWFASGRFGENWGRFPDEYNRLINFFGKFTIRPSSATKFTVSGLIEDTGFFSGKGQRGTGFGRKYSTEGINQGFGGKLQFNTVFSHTLSSKTFYEIRVSHLREYNDSYNPKYGKNPAPNPAIPANVTALGYNPLEAGQLVANVGYVWYGDDAYGLVTGNYTTQRPFTTDLNFNITSQATVNHQFKAGAGVTMYDYLDRRRGRAQGNAPEIFGEQNLPGGSNNVIKWSGFEYHVYPVEYALFAQDRMEYGGLIVNAGIRLDVFDPNANDYNPFRPRSGSTPDFDNLLDGIQFRTRKPSIKTGVAPRVGISHPITDKAALHYSYGIFNQRPTLDNLYFGLVQSQPFEGHGNTDLPFQKSTNYEMGVQAEVYPGYYLDVTGYFRDVDKLPISWRVIPESGFIGGSQREYNFLLPTIAQDARGLEISARKQMSHHFSVRANYTLAFTTDLTAGPGQQLSITNASELETTPRVAAYVRRAFANDRRHRIVANVLVDLPYNVSVSFLTRAQSGNEFRSKNESVIDPLGLLGKARRSPWTGVLDMYAQKVFIVGKNRLGVFTDIRNLTNRTNLYAIADSPGAERWIRRGDPVSFLGEPPGTIDNARDIYVGVNLSW